MACNHYIYVLSCVVRESGDHSEKERIIEPSSTFFILASLLTIIGNLQEKTHIAKLSYFYSWHNLTCSYIFEEVHISYSGSLHRLFHPNPLMHKHKCPFITYSGLISQGHLSKPFSHPFHTELWFPKPIRYNPDEIIRGFFSHTWQSSWRRHYATVFTSWAVCVCDD